MLFTLIIIVPLIALICIEFFLVSLKGSIGLGLESIIAGIGLLCIFVMFFGSILYLMANHAHELSLFFKLIS